MRLLLMFALTLGLSAQSKDLVIAERLAADIERNSAVLRDPHISAYLSDVAGKLTCAANSPITLKVIVADAPDAFVSFGGRIYLHTGFLHRAANEAELAGVIAHLIAYNNAYQPRPIEPAGMLVLSPYSYRNGLSTAPLALQQEARTAMRQADAQAIECLHASNYDPDAYLDAIGSLDAERYQAAAQIRASLTAKPEYILDREGFAALRQSLPRPATRRAARPPSLRNRN